MSERALHPSCTQTRSVLRTSRHLADNALGAWISPRKGRADRPTEPRCTLFGIVRAFVRGDASHAARADHNTHAPGWCAECHIILL